MKYMNQIKKYALAPAVISFGSMFPMIARADVEQTVVTAADWSSVITALTSQVSVSTIIAALATFMAASIGIVFMWWGLRKAVRTLMAAFRKGRISV